MRKWTEAVVAVPRSQAHIYALTPQEMLGIAIPSPCLLHAPLHHASVDVLKALNPYSRH